MNNKALATERGKVHYYVQGDGNTCMVFTHGATMDHGLFKHQINYFKHRFKVISWDVPCHGRSRPYNGFTIERAADDLLEILDNEGVTKAHFVGQSMGGYIIQNIFLTDKYRVSSLSMIGSNPFGYEYMSRVDRWMLNNIGTLQELIPYTKLVKAIANNITATQDSFDYAMDVLRKLSKREIIDITKVVYKGFLDYTKKISIDVPLLITYGDIDKTGKVQSYCNKWASEEGAMLKIVSNAAHNANMDNPKEFNTILDEFLNLIPL